MARPLRVLIVEDDPADAELEILQLRSAGFEPEARVARGEADYHAALGSPLDVVLSEFDLPGFGAPRALRILRERDADLPFIIVTRTMTNGRAAKCLREGATDYVLKDQIERLGRVVENAVDARRAREDKRLAEEALEQRELYYRRIFENSRDLLLIINPDGTPRFYSPSVLATFGRTPSDIEGRSVFEFIHPDDREAAPGGSRRSGPCGRATSASASSPTPFSRSSSSPTGN